MAFHLAGICDNTGHVHWRNEMNLTSGLYLLSAILCSASMAVVLRLFRSSQDNRYGMILGNYLICTCIGFLLLPDRGLILHAEPVTVLCGISGGILYVLSLVCMQSSIQSSGAILTSAFSKLGLLVPLAISILIFHERPGILQASGMVMVIAAVWIFSQNKETDLKSMQFDLGFLLIVLLTGGLSDSMAKIYDVYGVRSEDAAYFFFIFFCASVLTLFLLVQEGRKTGKKTSLRSLAAGILVGVPNYFSSVFLLKALNGIPATVAYPVFSAGSILLVTVISIPLFKEYLDRRQTAALTLILTAIVLLNL